MRTLGELMWSSKKDCKKPNCSTGKKENANCFGEKTGRINPTSTARSSRLHLQTPGISSSHLSSISPSLHLSIPSSRALLSQAENCFALSLSSISPSLPSPFFPFPISPPENCPCSFCFNSPPENWPAPFVSFFFF